MSIRIIQQRDENFDEAVWSVMGQLQGGGLVGGAGGDADVPAIVAGVIKRVSRQGDQAVIDFTEKFDHLKLDEFNIRVSQEQIDDAYSQAQPEFLELVRRVITNIRQYQEHILIQPPADLEYAGRRLGVRYTPIDRVGVYVPGGRAMYPSTVLMTVVPAQVAGVREIAIVSPPTGGDINPMVLALAGELGVHEVYRVGGAQAVAALALGTDQIPAVDKIVGPGNAFVAEAKRQLSGKVGIDSIAGPSEVLIIADDSANPAWLAADMLAQAEHDPGSSILLTNSLKLAQAVSGQVEQQLSKLSRAEAIRKSIDSYGAIIVVESFELIYELANQFATEHMQIVTRCNDVVLQHIRHAGAIFVGQHTPVPLGDYYAGPSHVLPTGSTARFYSALSCNDFRKASSVISYDERALAEDGNDVADFATREGLTAHAAAVKIRTQKS